ncbi:MAG: hypothetical protein M3440_04535, partial [Chloroflexota bacterium]|nr:hypothetical protein [Chloroflexota bacterium]
MVTTLNPILRHVLFCTVNGIPTAAYEADGQCGVDRPIGTGSITIAAPLPDHIDLNVPIEIQGGYADGVIRTLFSGRVTDTQEEMTDRGALVTINAEGWAALLDWEQETDLVFAGPIAFYEICRSLCALRGIPTYVIDQITDPDGVTTIMLGGNPDYEDGNVVIPRRTSPLAWMRRTLGLFG